MSDLCPTLSRDGDRVVILDQTRLPWEEKYIHLADLNDAATAIRHMQVRGAPLIGATAAFGIALALQQNASDQGLAHADAVLRATRPTAVNLHWALDRMQQALHALPAEERSAAAWAAAEALRAADATANYAIGQHGQAMLQGLAASKTTPLQLMTHCNAGWLATCGHGTALAPIYAAHRAGLALHVFVSETRPRNQGLLTAWELARAGIAHTLIADNAAGWLLTEGKVDCVITGADRIAANGDTANKVGTYLKALAAQAHGVPFYIAAPRSTMDFNCASGRHIPIEERSGEELRVVQGHDAAGQSSKVHITGARTQTCNPAFDVTPAALVTGIICEFGIYAASALTSIRQDAYSNS